jgi:hypothetical protein
VVLCIHLSYTGSWFPYPWENKSAIPGYPADENIRKAFAYLKEHRLDNTPLVHQMPFINAQQGWDPWAEAAKAKTFYIWSLDKDPEKDWLPDSSVVLWDGWHAVRDAPMPLHAMRALPHYKEIATFPAADTTYSVRLFLKTAR